MKKLTSIFPFLVCVAPILFLWAHNFPQVELIDLLAPAAITVACCTILIALLWLLRKDYLRSALIVSFFAISFFSYGHLFDFLWKIHLLRHQVDLHSALSVYLALVNLALAAIVWKSSRDLKPLASFLTIAAGIMILASMGTALAQLFTIARSQGANDSEFGSSLLNASRRQSSARDPENLPDIYYIILDSYGRADTLQRMYGHDNSAFISYLKDKGFYVAEQSWSNYPITKYSLTSSLNMQYLDRLLADSSKADALLTHMLRAPLIARYLKSKGYTYVHFNTYAYETRESNIADVTYDYTPLLGREFIRILLRTTMLRGLEKMQPMREMADSTLYNFEKLLEVPHIGAPTFTFVHFIPPHHPFIFDRNGNYTAYEELAVAPRKLQDMYIEQLIFMTKCTEKLVGGLLEESSTRPVIILQADHGGGYQHSFPEPMEKETDRLSILNAYYVPENFREQLYPSITPVNTFRLLLKYCFGENVERLPDISYYFHGDILVQSTVAGPHMSMRRRTH